MPTRKHFRERRKRRHAEALIRQEEYGSLTTEQKIARAEGRRGESKRELRRLRNE